MNQEQLISSLVDEMPEKGFGKLWAAPARTVLYFGILFVVAGLGMQLLQAYRPNAIEHILHFPWFTIQLLSAFVISFLLLFWNFQTRVPGNELPGWLWPSVIAVFALFGFSIYASFAFPGPDVGPLGGRFKCNAEVVLYGLVGAIAVVWGLSRANVFRETKGSLFRTSVAVGIVPAAWMQLFCAYHPLHAVKAHYGPILVVLAVVLLIAGIQQFRKSLVS